MADREGVGSEVRQELRRLTRLRFGNPFAGRDISDMTMTELRDAVEPQEWDGVDWPDHLNGSRFDDMTRLQLDGVVAQDDAEALRELFADAVRRAGVIAAQRDFA